YPCHPCSILIYKAGFLIIPYAGHLHLEHQAV
ncbi:unnamed protein product, partial [marine sediment metagenome]